MICWHSQSLPLLLLLMLTIHQGLASQLACNYSTIVDSIIDVQAAVAKGMKSLDIIQKRSKEECLEECCSGLPTRSRGYPCNFVTFHPTDESPNCYLFYCPEKDVCPTIRLTGYNSYIIENDQTNVEILITRRKNSQSREKSSNNGIPFDIRTSAPGLTLSRRTINIFPLTTIHSRIKQPTIATTFKAPMILLSTSSTKTTSSFAQLPVKTTSLMTTKESTATSTLQKGPLLTFAKMVPTTVFPIIRPIQIRTAALPIVSSVTSMLTGAVLPTTTQAIATITNKPLAATTPQTTSIIQPTMTTVPSSTFETTSSQSLTTTILTSQPTVTTLPITTDQTTATTLPITTDQTTTTTLPITTDQTTTTTLPITTDQPTTTILPITTNQNTTTTLPITTDQPTTTTLPITTNQPTTTTLPVTNPLPTTTLAMTTNQPTTTLPTTTSQPTTTATLQTSPSTMATTFPTTTAQPSMRTTPLIHQTSTTTPRSSLQTTAAQLKTALPETHPNATITTVVARELNPAVTQQPTESGNAAAKTPFFQIITAVSISGDTNKKDDEEKDPRQNLGGQNESAGTFGDSQMEIKGGLITALLFGLLFLTIVIVVLSKQVIESYRRRHYTKMDFVMNGIYIDA